MAIVQSSHNAFTDAVDGFVFSAHHDVQYKSCFSFRQELHEAHAVAKNTKVSGIILIDLKLQGLLVHHYNQCSKDFMLITM